MTRKTLFLWLLLTCLSSFAFAQNGIIRGRVFNISNNEPLAFASVVVQETQKGVTTDENGKFEITGLEPGVYNVVAQYIGFEKKVIPEVRVTNSRAAEVNIGLEEKTIEKEEVVVKSSPFTREKESPVSKRTIGVNEIRRSPGGNMDISNVIKTLPGVASTVSFRNDLIIRGGAPNENRFYIDGIEVPNINHFATQGATGGPVGMINVNFVRSVDFYSGAFPANRANALSAVLELDFREGNSEDFGFTGMVGASEVGFAIEGPIGDKFTYLVSARRSYLQFLFSVFGLPFLPTYNDVSFKFKYKLNQKNHFTLLGLGAIDEFKLNKEANETEQQRYILNNLPVNNQWNYTRGLKYTHFGEKGYWNVIFSRYKLNNEIFKYEDNIEQPENLVLDYESIETKNQFRIENIYRDKGYKLTYGVNYNYTTYENNTFNKIGTPTGVDTINYSSKLDFHNWGAFAQISRGFFEDRLSLSLGIRADANSYSDNMNNLLDQLSPRFSAAYELFPDLFLNFNTGLYYQKPPLTVMGYQVDDEFVNKNELKYIRSTHFVAGVEYLTETNTKLSVEGFYKDYDNYPFLLDDSISLANLGSDFGVVGTSPADATSEGRSYGLEFLIQQKLYKGFYGILAYTLVWSEFTDKNSEYVPSAWDNRHIVSVTGGKRFEKNWEVGVRWSFQSGAPYTPYDIGLSSRAAVWDITGQGLPDYDRLNTERLPAVHALDVRVDKKYFFDKWSLDVYLDVQNAYGFQANGQPYLTVRRDAQGNPQPDPNTPGSYDTYLLDNEIGSTIPSIGIIVEI